MLAEQFQQLIAYDFQYLLIWGKLQQDFRAQGLGANAGEKLVGNVYVDVAIQQRFANAAQRRVQVFFGELPLAAQVLENALKFLRQIFKHDLGTRRSAEVLASLHSRRR